jgi:hypothetical protein
MKKLTQPQKKFLLENFFKKEEIPGWKNIAEKLLETGKCIVAGDTCIWKGGIGYFIGTKDVKDAVGCIEYVFALEMFLSSKWYEDFKAEYIEQLKTKIEVLRFEQTNIEKLVK